MQRTDSFEKPLMLGKIEGGRRRGQQRMRWLDGILTRWTRVWVSSGSWWWTGKPGVLWFMGLQRVGHNCVTELSWTDRCSILKIYDNYSYYLWSVLNVLSHLILTASFRERNSWHTHLRYEAQKCNSFATKLRSGRIRVQAAWFLCWALSSSPSAVRAAPWRGAPGRSLAPLGSWDSFRPPGVATAPGAGTLRLLGYYINSTRKSKRKEKIEFESDALWNF